MTTIGVGLVGYFIRQATLNDLSFIQSELVGFIEFYGSHLFLDCAHTEETATKLSMLIQNHIFYICELNGEPTGFICGLVSPHFFNSKKMTLTELFWWVKPEHREGRSGYLLLKKFAEMGKNFDWCIMTIEDKSPVKPESLKKFGFKLKEINFILEKEF
jgi:hypothetical protein